MKCPKCGEDEFEVTTIDAGSYGDTDRGMCCYCEFVIYEGDKDFEKVIAEVITDGE